MNDGPASGAYVARVCITDPVEGAVLSGAPTFTVTVTAVSGTLPPIDRVRTYLTRSSSTSNSALVTDYLSPYTIQIPTSRYRDGSYRLATNVYFEDDFTTSVFPSVSVTLSNGVSSDVHSSGSWTPKTSGASPITVAAVGDGAGGLPGATAVGNLVSGMNPDLFLYLGDVYNSGTYGEFFNYYEPTLGSVKHRTNPVPGNHETGDGFEGYMDYWDSNQHYYSYDSGGWHFIALDTTEQYGQTAAGSAQYNWLAQDLAANANTACTMVYFHHPRFGLTNTNNYTYIQDIWSLLATSGVDVVLNGHEHNYQRWQPMDSMGQPATDGMLQFIAGAGGHELMPFGRSDSRVTYRTSTDGALKFSLSPTGGSAQYLNTSGSVMDSTSFNCHDGEGEPIPTPTPDPNAPLAFEPVADAMVQEAAPDANSGKINAMRADTSPNEISYLRFDVQGATEPITRAILRLWVRDGTDDAPAIATSADVTWSETGITWTTKPAVGEPGADLGAVGTGTWIEYDVTSLVAGNGPVTLALMPQSTNALSVNTRENASNRPQLLIGGVAEPPPDPTPGETTEFLAAADARVLEAAPTTNYAASYLRADGGIDPEVESYLKFSVTGFTGTPTSAKVRLFVDTGTNAGSQDGPALYAATSSIWSETGITWANRPARGTTALGDLGPVSAGTWVEYDVSSVVTGNGDYTFALATTSADAADFNSRETANQPRLVLGSAAVDPPSDPPTDPPSDGALTFEPVADAMVQEALPDANNGLAPALHADLGPNEMSYLRFDVLGAPESITKATLRLWVQSGTADAPAVATSADVTWSETGITWTTRPATAATGADLGAVGNGVWIDYDVTSLVTGNGPVTLALIPQSSDGISISSRENATGKPKLLITGESGPVDPPTDPPAESTSLEPVADAMVLANVPDANSGTTTSMHADLSPNEMSYLRFDVPSGTVSQATLRLWVRSGTVDAPAVASSSDVTWSETGITWNTKPAVGEPGADLGPVETGTWIEYDVTGLVSGGAPVTLALIPQSNDGISLNTRENTTNKPELIISGEAEPVDPPPDPPTDPPADSTLTFEPVADAMVQAVVPDANAGTSPQLHADLAPNQEMSYLRFDVQTGGAPITHATLRLWVRAFGGTANAPAVATSDDVSWTETGITWNTKPPVGATGADLGAVGESVWIEYDVTSLVTGDGPVTLALVPQAADGISINSRENATSRPELVITTSGEPGTLAAPRSVAPATVSADVIDEPAATPVVTEPAATPVPSEAATEAPTETEAPPQTGTVVNTGGAGVRCRVSPTADGTIITVVPEGGTVTLRGAQEGEWLPVRCDGQDGYVSAQYIVITEGTAPVTAPTEPTTGEETPIETATATSEAPVETVVTTEVPTEAGEIPVETPTPTPYPVLSGWQTDPNKPWTLVTDNDPSTVWAATVAPPAQAELGLDLGGVVPVETLRVLPTAPLTGTIEIQLSNDGVNWYSLTTVQLEHLAPDVWVDLPIGYYARYTRLIVTNPGGAPSVGNLAEIQVWVEPSGAAQALNLLPLVTPTPVPTEAPTEIPVAPAVETSPTEVPVAPAPTEVPVIEPTPEPTLAPEPTPVPAEPPSAPEEPPADDTPGEPGTDPGGTAGGT